MQFRHRPPQRAPRVGTRQDLPSEQGIVIPEPWFRAHYARNQWERFDVLMAEMPGHQELVALTRDFKAGLERDLPNETWNTLRQAWALKRITDPARKLDRRTILFQQVIADTPIEERTPDRLREHLQRTWMPMAMDHRETLAVLREPLLYRPDTPPRVVLERLWNTAAEESAEGMTRTFQGVPYDRRIGGRTPSYHQVRSGEVTIEDVLAAAAAGDRAAEDAAIQRAAMRAAGLREAVSLLKGHFARSTSTHLPRLRQIIERGSQGRLFLEIEHPQQQTRAVLYVGRPGSGWMIPGPAAESQDCAAAFLRFLALEADATTRDPSYDNTLRYTERQAEATADLRDPIDVIKAA